jgi:hypothetical protein
MDDEVCFQRIILIRVRFGFRRVGPVCCRMHTLITNVSGIMSFGTEELRQSRRQRVIDEESQAVRGRSNSRSVMDAAA